MGDSDKFTFYDLAPTQESFRDAVIAGLRREPKSLPCKFFYDARGSAAAQKTFRNTLGPMLGALYDERIYRPVD